MCRTSAVKRPNEGDDADDDADDGGRAPLRRTVPIGNRAKIDAMHVVFLQVASHPFAYVVSYLPRGLQCNCAIWNHTCSMSSGVQQHEAPRY